MSFDDFLENPFGLQLLNHSILDISIPYDIWVRIIKLPSLLGLLLLLISGLIKIHILIHDNCLQTEQYLQQIAGAVPGLSVIAPPRPQQRETDVAVGVEVGVETDLVVAGRH